MPYFESPVDGVRLHYADHGPASGPVAVFAASAYLGHEMWESQALPLAEAGFRCVGYDRRGHGRSDDAWSGYDLDTLADDLHGLLAHLGLRRATLIGHSVGAAEVVRCLTRHGGGRVARAALVSGLVPGIGRSPSLPNGIGPEFVQADDAAFRADRAAYFAASADDFFAAHLPGNRVSPAYVDHLIARCLTSTLRASDAVRRLSLTLDVTAELSSLTVPFLLVHGTHDTSAPLPVTGERASRLLTDADLRVYEDAGHGLFATHGHQLLADLREFIGEPESRTTTHRELMTRQA
ncbi:alpha/beta hydrolase [Streptomyces sp. J2-1]|uniref:alpha/beta fold hydrolase n=1 Tax=Streptomyces corallincola TaxID=2851888 RepID=UPI001C389316|nr:alpha/beta hydrolase [Streptomyces corallincola]MBV2357096.1 alpha/beta hydrolase [Streptomyces corallincola]